MIDRISLFSYHCFMKVALSIILIFFISFFSFANWVQFKEYKKGYPGSNKKINFGESIVGHIFYDKDSIKRDGNKLY